MISKDELAAYLRQNCDALLINDESIGLVERIWCKWNASGVSRPEASVPEIAGGFWDAGFFVDILAEAIEVRGQQLKVEYHAPITGDRNFRAISLSDGAAVVVDEGFLQFLFYICLIGWFETDRNIVSEKFPELIQAMRDMAKAGANQAQPLKDVTVSQFEALLSTSFDIAEAATYLFDSFKVFIIGHEIGHHVTPSEKAFKTWELSATPKAHQSEYSADMFGLQVFRSLLDRPVQRTYAAFAYRFIFAPALLLSILQILNQVSRGCAEDLPSATHPRLSDRISHLQDKSWRQDDWDLFNQLKETIEQILLGSGV